MLKFVLQVSSCLSFFLWHSNFLLLHSLHYPSGETVTLFSLNFTVSVIVSVHWRMWGAPAAATVTMQVTKLKSANTQFGHMMWLFGGIWDHLENKEETVSGLRIHVPGANFQECRLPIGRVFWPCWKCCSAILIGMHRTEGCALKPHYTYQEQSQLHACVLLAVSTVCGFVDTKELSIQAGRSQMHKTVGLH